VIPAIIYAGMMPVDTVTKVMVSMFGNWGYFFVKVLGAFLMAPLFLISMSMLHRCLYKRLK
jgi:hypothetical protein